MKRILAASDLSPGSDRAVARAVLLARRHQAKLRVMHIVDDELPAAIADRQKQDAEAALLRMVRSLAGEPLSIAFEVDVRLGAHDEAIIDSAERLDADLVVIGRHRRDVLLDLFRGSTGERIIRFGSRPVLVVNDRPEHDYGSLLVAVDFSAPCRNALEVACQLAPQADLRLVHAFDIPFRGLLFGGTPMDQLAKKHQQQFLDMVQSQTRDFVATFSRPLDASRMIVREGAPVEVVLAAVEATRPDLLVAGTHGRSGLGRALLGSVAEALLARAPCDVLAVRGW